MVQGESDTNLAARLRGHVEGESAYAVALLLARHWQSTYDYAAICLAVEGDLATMAATSAFHRVLGLLERGESNRALRPQLLVAVRETVREWSAEDGISAVLPELRKPTGGRGLRAARARTSENRQLAERSFGVLPRAAQYLLWHTEVEAEPLSVPAGLVGVDSVSAATALEQAREQFRTACVHAHRELAPSNECRFYNRLLDVPIRRGGALLPDVEQHLLGCRHCRHAAEQLSHFEGELGTLIAEAVLGWGARRYLDSRPGRGGPGAFPRKPAARGGGSGRGSGSGGRHRLMAHLPLAEDRFVLPGRRRRAVAVGVGVMSFALLASVLGARNWSHDSTVPTATWGTASGYSAGPGVASPSPADPGSASPSQGDGSSTAPAAYPGAGQHGRLHHDATGLCLDIRGGRVLAGAGTRLAVCSSALTQQWSYEYDGLLRSLADPRLCLDSHGADGDVVLSGCVGSAADEVRYDLTVQGELLPRWREELAVVPVTLRAGADVVVKPRSGSAGETWTLVPERSASDSGKKGDRQESDGAATGGKEDKADKDAKGGEEEPKPKGKGETGPNGTQQGPESHSGDGTSGAPGASEPSPEATPDQQFETRYVADDGTEQQPAPIPAADLQQPLDAVKAVVVSAVRAVGSLTQVSGRSPS
ncbi:ricin-type beta-trefoil lectin domain protein [Streptomyces sp. WI04-05B]|uniref:ricin-type beta-trefoil lectin domain protein n=1 Tax=Streptomyces TaxID=1883 RepID=UPI0029BEF397|nr:MULTISPECIES: ricin-type beta-trefoil lectin domain protein [unclassified Streptomyces]MDX2545001.1 ricin-type beta-trefoil lectin domain protein [Streptomyces sp. WI04-05B]MDX2587492.1 ricin-type beta-trefoil lectin domain protein [Streptomyces sp. WI04-05A]